MFDLNNGNVTKETAGSREGDQEFATADPGRRVTGPAESRMPPWEEPRRSRTRSEHRRRSPTDPKQGGPFKVMPFDPKEMRSDVWVHNFECAIIAYFKGAHVSNHLKRELFFDSLSN